MKMRIINKTGLLFVIIIMMPFAMQAQTKTEGTVNIYAGPGIDSLVQLHIAYNQSYPMIPGYRIQIFMESGNQALTDSEEVQQKFLEKYKNIPAYITFSAPYYRVRVGDFRTRLNAENFLHQINYKYPNAWVIKDEINLPELTTNQKPKKNE